MTILKVIVSQLKFDKELAEKRRNLINQRSKENEKNL